MVLVQKEKIFLSLSFSYTSSHLIFSSTLSNQNKDKVAEEKRTTAKNE